VQSVNGDIQDSASGFFFVGICGRKILEDFNEYIIMYHLIYRGNAKLAKVSKSQLFSNMFYMNS